MSDKRTIFVPKTENMNKTIASIIVMGVLAVGVPQQAYAVPSIEIVDNDFQTISLSISSENVLRVAGAAGQTLSIYNVTGVMVMTTRVDSSDKSYALNLPKGCYIVKVGKLVRKISIR